MKSHRAPKPRKGRPYELVSRRSKQSREEWLKEVSKILEHDKNLEVAIRRIQRLPRRELEARQTKYLVAIVKAGKSQQALMDVARMSPEEFRDFIIGKLLHNHS